MNITVFCSQYDVAEKYKRVAEKLATLIAAGTHTLVWGGSDEGLMGIIARGVHDGGSRTVGVMREQIKDKAYKDVDEMTIVKNAYEMNVGLVERGDAVVALVGGIGTLNELTELVRMIKNGVRNKPMFIVNTDHFYEGFKTQLRTMHDEGFLREDVIQSVRFVDTPEDAIRCIEKLHT